MRQNTSLGTFVCGGALFGGASRDSWVRMPEILQVHQPQHGKSWLANQRPPTTKWVPTSFTFIRTNPAVTRITICGLSSLTILLPFAEWICYVSLVFKGIDFTMDIFFSCLLIFFQAKKQLEAGGCVCLRRVGLFIFSEGVVRRMSFHSSMLAMHCLHLCLCVFFQQQWLFYGP